MAQEAIHGKMFAHKLLKRLIPDKPGIEVSTCTVRLQSINP